MEGTLYPYVRSGYKKSQWSGISINDGDPKNRRVAPAFSKKPIADLDIQQWVEGHYGFVPHP
jgi:hypothetical protein